MQHHIRCVVGEVDEGGRRPAAARLVHAEQLVSAGNLTSALSLPIALRDKLTGLDARTFCSHDMLSSSIVLSPAHQSHDMRSTGIETARRTADVHASQLPAHHEPIHSLLLIFASISARASSSVIPPGARVGQNNCVMPTQRKRSTAAGKHAVGQGPMHAVGQGPTSAATCLERGGIFLAVPASL